MFFLIVLVDSSVSPSLSVTVPGDERPELLWFQSSNAGGHKNGVMNAKWMVMDGEEKSILRR